MSTSNKNQAGFTLIEMLIVVVIMGVLATLAMHGYSRWIGRARRSEAVAMLAEISAKEQIYLNEFAAYHPLRNDGKNPPDVPSPDEQPGFFYPVSPAATTFNSTHNAVIISNAAAWPTGWRNIGLRPRRQETYCTYLANVGRAGQAVPAAATVGAAFMSGAGDTATNWFYALAACNMSGVAGYPNDVTVMVVTHNSPTIRIRNDGR